MKGQFFVMSTVIMIYTLMSLIQYVYDFNINVPEVKKMPETEYIQYVKDAINGTISASKTSLDCSKVQTDLLASEAFLRQEMMSRGMSLTVQHTLSCSPIGAYVNFSITSPNFYSFTEFNA
jgi:hypothetical protein